MRMLCTGEFNPHSYPSKSNELEPWLTTQEVKDAETTTNSSSNSLVLVILSVLALEVILSALVLLLILSVLYNQGL